MHTQKPAYSYTCMDEKYYNPVFWLLHLLCGHLWCTNQRKIRQLWLIAGTVLLNINITLQISCPPQFEQQVKTEKQKPVSCNASDTDLNRSAAFHCFLPSKPFTFVFELLNSVSLSLHTHIALNAASIVASLVCHLAKGVPAQVVGSCQYSGWGIQFSSFWVL